MKIWQVKGDPKPLPKFAADDACMQDSSAIEAMDAREPLMLEDAPVFCKTGNPDADATLRANSQMRSQSAALDKPTVVFLPGKETVANVSSEEDRRLGINLKDTRDIAKKKKPYFSSLEYSQKETIKNVNKFRSIYLGGENSPEFFVCAYTDSHIAPPGHKEEGGARIWLKDHAGEASRSVTRVEDYKGSRLRQVFAHKEHAAEFYSTDAMLFVDDFLMPALRDKTGDFLPKSEMMKKLDNLTLVGFSYGSIFCKELENCLIDRLTNQEATLAGKGHFAKEDAADIMRHVVTMSPSNVAHVRGTQNLFTGVYFEGRHDARRRFVQDRGSESVRGLQDLSTMQSVFGTHSTPEQKERDGGKGLEIRSRVGFKGDTLRLDNSQLVLFDAPESYMPNASLEDIYSKEYYAEGLHEQNPEHHRFGGMFFADPDKQGHALVFNRVLQNAIERSERFAGLPDSSKEYVKSLFADHPKHSNVSSILDRQTDKYITKGRALAKKLIDAGPPPPPQTTLEKGANMLNGTVDAAKGLVPDRFISGK